MKTNPNKIRAIGTRLPKWQLLLSLLSHTYFAQKLDLALDLGVTPKRVNQLAREINGRGYGVISTDKGVKFRDIHGLNLARKMLLK